MKKKLIFVIATLHLGGAEKSLVALLQNLDYSKYDVDLLTFHKGGMLKEYIPGQVNIIVIESPGLTIAERIRYVLKKKIIRNYHNIQLYWQIAGKKFKGIDKHYDIAIAYNQGFPAYYINQYVNSEKKYVWQNTDYKKAGYNIDFDYEVYRNYTKIIAVSPEAKEGLESKLKEIGRSLEIEIIKDITDKNIILQQAEKQPKVFFSPDKINIVTVGRLVKPKGLNLAIEACGILLKKGYDINWYIVGEGTERKDLEKQIKRNQLENNFLLLGQDPNPYPYMKHSDIYVQTSLFEGLGLTVIEASYLAKPIVSTNFQTVNGIIKNEETGLIAEMNAESIASQIERLITDKELKNRFIMNLSGRENRDKEESLKQIEELLND